MLDESETMDISALGLKFQDGLIGRITKSQHAAYVQLADTVIRQDRETRKLIYLQSVEVRNLIALALRKAVKHGVAWVCAPDVVIAKNPEGTYTLLTLGDLDPTFAKPEGS